MAVALGAIERSRGFEPHSPQIFYPFSWTHRPEEDDELIFHQIEHGFVEENWKIVRTFLSIT